MTKTAFKPRVINEEYIDFF